MAITMQEEISEVLYNLSVDTTVKKYVLTQLTSIIKQLADIKNILKEQTNTLMATTKCLAEHSGHQ